MIVARPDISIIIVTYNSTAVIAPCLRSIADHHGELTIETLVVDNGSNDDTCSLIRQQFHWARIISGQGNIGFAAANNIGFEAARGRHFLVLNPDTEIRPRALQIMLDYAEAHTHVGMIAPHMVNIDGSLQHSTFRFPNYRQAVYGFFEKFVPINSVENGRYPSHSYSRERAVDHILGAAIFVQRQLWEHLGGMDEEYTLYFEETDWCYRARQAGWKLHYIPAATIMHRGAHATSSAPERSSVLFARSQARYYRKNLGLWAYVMLKQISVLGLIYWFSRSFVALFRRRISPESFIRRVRSYWWILSA